MNREIRELFDKKNITTKKITIKKDVRIIDTGDNKFVIKKRDKDLEDLFMEIVKNERIAQYIK